MSYTIVRALPTDAPRLKEIAVAAKAHWGYAPEWMARWAQLVQVKREYVTQHEAYKAVADNIIIGWHSVILRQPTALLDHLWVEPAWIGKGVGRALFEHARQLAQQQGAQRLELEAEPYAVGFYHHMGAVIIGEVESDMGRNLPIMELIL